MAGGVFSALEVSVSAAFTVIPDKTAKEDHGRYKAPIIPATRLVPGFPILPTES